MLNVGFQPIQGNHLRTHVLAAILAMAGATGCGLTLGKDSSLLSTLRTGDREPAFTDGKAFAFGLVQPNTQMSHVVTLDLSRSGKLASITNTAWTTSEFAFRGIAPGLKKPFPGETGTCVSGATGSCTIAVEFMGHSDANLYSDVLKVHYVTQDGKTGTLTMDVSAAVSMTATPALLTLNPGQLDFSGVTIGGLTRRMTQTITNTGDSSATGMSASSLAAPFSFAGGAYPGAGGTCGTWLAGHSTCAVEIDFAPSAPITSTATWNLGYTARMTTETVSSAVKGYGLLPAQLSINPGLHDYGTAETGTHADQTYSVRNTGDIDADAVTLSVSGSSAFSVVTQDCGSSIMPTPGPSCSIIVRFAPTAPGSHQGTLTVTYYDGASAGTPVTVALSGTAVTTAELSLASADGPDFGNVYVGTQTGPRSERKITVTNVGAAPASSITPVTAPSGTFEYTGGFYPGRGGDCGAALAPSASCTLVVSFRPASSGSSSATFELGYNNGLNTRTRGIGLSGKGFQVTKLAAGLDFTCALTSSGHVRCWGSDAKGTLGNGAPAERSPVPAPVPAFAGTAIDLAAGREHLCAVRGDGEVHCWGDNGFFQIGASGPTGDFRSEPTKVGGLPNATVSVALGFSHSCALQSDGTVWCWGRNEQGQLGNLSVNGRTQTPVQVQGLAGVSSIAAGGDTTCALKINGDLYCWGLDDRGQVGNGPAAETCDSLTCAKSPALIATGASRVTVGRKHACALFGSAAFCWGDNNRGQLGIGISGTSPVLLPTPIPSGAYQEIAAGEAHTCAIEASTRALRCWGADEAGQLGHTPGTGDSPVPTPVVTDEFTSAAAIALGSAHSCVLTPSDKGSRVHCWGSSSNGQLGNGTMEGAETPRSDVIGFPREAADVASGYDHSCALLSTGEIKCWGADHMGQVGDGPLFDPALCNGLECRRRASLVRSITDAVQVTAGQAHSCALTWGGEVKCWGQNDMGQRGDGTSTPLEEPGAATAFPAGLKMTWITAGASHSCALDRDGKIWCWGKRDQGQLGNETIPPANCNSIRCLSPVAVTMAGSFSKARMISAGAAFSCALSIDKTPFCWGSNEAAALGSGSSSPVKQTSPVEVASLAGQATGITAGFQHVCVRLTNDELRCWGQNNDAELGNDRSSPTEGPVPVLVNSSSRLQGAKIVAAGVGSTCAINALGAHCWGTNEHGQIGTSGGGGHAYVATQIPGSGNMKTVSVGNAHACSVTAVNGVHVAQCWGRNEYGCAGTSAAVALDDQIAPATVLGL